MTTCRTYFGACALVVSILTLACDRGVIEPEPGTRLRPRFSETESGFSVVNVQLRPADGSAATMWGGLTMLFGALHPPNPICEHDAIDATVAVCGVIHNPDLQSLEGGELRATFSRTGSEILLRFAFPPSPVCPTYQVRASASLPAVQINPDLPQVDVLFRTSTGSIVGGNPGPPTVQPGPPNDTEGQPGPPNNPEQNPGPPTCQVTFAGG
jgi:hypothetical protein